MQFAQCESHHLAFAAGCRKRRRLRRRSKGRYRAQGIAQRIGIVGLDCCNARAIEAETGKDRFGQRDRLVQAGDIMARLGADQHSYRGRAIGNGARDGLQPDLRDLVDLDGQHVRRQSVAVPRQRVDQRAAVLGIMKHDDGLRAASLAIGRKQSPQFPQQRVRWRQRIGRGARRAGGGALPASRADMRVNGDVIAGGRNGAGRAEIETAPAADDLRARMRAQVFREIDVARLVERAGQVARFEH